MKTIESVNDNYKIVYKLLTKLYECVISCVIEFNTSFTGSLPGKITVLNNCFFMQIQNNALNLSYYLFNNMFN